MDFACRELVERVSELIDGELDADTRAHLEQHLLICPDCVEYVREVRQTIGWAAALADPPAPATEASSLDTKLLRAFRSWKGERRKGRGS